MPLSKNLYELDNLSAELLWRLEQNDLRGAREVSNELHSSLESELVWKTLTFAWLLSPADPHSSPVRYRAFLSRRYDEFLEYFRVVPFQISPYPEPVTTPAPLLPETDTRPPINWTITPPGWSDGICNSICYHIHEALMKKQCWRAYLIARPLLAHSAALCSFLRAFGINDDLLNFSTPALNQRILEHSMYILAYPMNPFPIIADFDYDTCRSFSIHPQAISRWHTPSKPTTDLIGFPKFIFDDTPFWRALTNKYHINPDPNYDYNGESEEMAIEFFRNLFPTDIPDEWSEQERVKSHGIPYTPDLANPWVKEFHTVVYTNQTSASISASR